ncbi:thiamine pyrophosphate-dependent dehydrogenase E1 component subunit alpha [Halorussus salilacus]|uniref:thiamine pyrophosphate-dependent dehydrogenase E1 component subunit alpha n=1 Tax=Halorussus salilacus TaxID=2953750 RepID=UPI0020A06353|nr:thiamine pyrophosphate-dependent dehydrogenase E1 component subunit alpha [Halorussus salilacus]USZ67626.1 thiamine pyrophosphate-dependent dehydrogenase E1 component subunit alpha [Halorussus salilacus]
MNRIIGERDLSETSFSPEQAREVYRDMVRARAFDERALALQRRGWMSSWPPYKGQEGSQVGAAAALDEEDWLFPTYRSNAMQIARDVPMSDILLFRRGRPEFESGHDVPNFPQAVPIATQIPHAAGAGMAMNYEKSVKESGEGDATDAAALCYFGDGATSEGDFHEGLNFAGVFDAPVVFFCENNEWAISLPRHKQTASDSIAVKADAYGFEGVQVDGNDPLAVRETVSEALDSARSGDPVLVESLTYRQGAHTTSDDPSQYEETRRELPEWRTADPLDRYEAYLREQDALDDEFVAEVEQEADAELDEAVERAESVEDADPHDVFDRVYADLPPNLQKQKAWLDSFIADRDVQELDH